MRKLAVLLVLFALLDVGGPRAQKKYVALTFDDGPTGRYTARLLDILSEKKVKATFFLCGYRVEQYPALTARIAQEGHEIGLHGFAHENFSQLSDDALNEELMQECLEIGEVSGFAPKLVRPPCGKLPCVENNSAFSEYAVILWSVDPLDWATDNSGQIVRRVTAAVRPGDIILMHDASDSSVDAAEELIDRLLQEGYTFLTVSALAAEYGTPLDAGCVYRRFGA